MGGGVGGFVWDWWCFGLLVVVFGLGVCFMFYVGCWVCGFGVWGLVVGCSFGGLLGVGVGFGLLWVVVGV